MSSTIRKRLDPEPFRIDLHGAFVRRTDLSGASLVEANFARADATGANFRDADFDRANLNDTILVGADLTGARNLTVDNCRVQCWTRRQSFQTTSIGQRSGRFESRNSLLDAYRRVIHV